MRTNKTLFFSMVFVFFAICSFSASSQNVEKAYKYIAEKNYSKAIDILNDAIKEKKDIVQAKFGLAKIYADQSNKEFNLSKSYRNLRVADTKFPKLPAKEKEMLKSKFGIDQEQIGLLKKNVAGKALDKAKLIHSIEEYNLFINIYEGSDECLKAIELRNSIAFAQAEKENTVQSYKSFSERYPDANQTNIAKDRYQTMIKNLYNQYSSEGDWVSLNMFENEYFDFPLLDSNADLNKKMAEFARQLMLTNGFNEKYINYYETYIKTAAPKELAFVVMQIMISPHIYSKEWDKAITLVKRYQPFFQTDDKRFPKLIEILSNKSFPLDAKNLSDSINTYANEYAPVITANGKIIYFCGRDRDDNLGYEDIFESQFINGKWGVPRLLNGINTAFAHEAPLSISADGNRMLLYTNSDVYYSDKTIDSWTPPKPFPSINTPKSWEADAMVSADGNAVFFISDRKGNLGLYHPFGTEFHGGWIGNLDIYVSIKEADGNWGTPINLGASINTPFGERSPFLHPDMKTLYFSSDGRGGLGKLDVYKCTRLSDTSWTQWSEPINLGKEINTPEDEYDYKITTNGQIAYFSAFKEGNNFIAYVDLPKEYQPEQIATISGKIYDKASLKPLEVEVKWEDLTAGKVIGVAKNDPKDGSYFITLPLGKLYGYFVEKVNYYPASGNIDLRDKKGMLEVERDIEMISIDQLTNTQTAIPLQNLFFDYDKVVLKHESVPELNRLAAFLKNNSHLKVEISGHTDDKGNDGYNKTLSENRAKAVYDYLISIGYDQSKLSFVGYGSAKPVDSNKTESGRARNRRVEFRVVK